MTYKFVSGETPGLLLQNSLPGNICHSYVYGVVIPYSSNLRHSRVSSEGSERLSFYSSFALNAAIEMYENHIFQKFILFSDATFGKKRKSTGTLMKEALLRTCSTRSIQESDIILFGSNSLNNTPAQIKELTGYLKKNNLSANQFLVIDWGFHNERICKYMEGFGTIMDTITVEEAHEYYNPKFQFRKLYQVLPKSFEKREKKLSLLANFDRCGFIPRFMKRLTGSVVTDIRKVRVSNKPFSKEERTHLAFDNISGKKKLYRLER